MRDIGCHTCVLHVQCSRDKSWHLGIFLNISKFSPWHGTHYFTWPASPRVLPSFARQIACHGVNRLSRQCEACFNHDNVCTTWHRRTCLNCAGRPATSKDAVNCALGLAATAMYQDVVFSSINVRQTGLLLRRSASMELFTGSFEKQYINCRTI